MATAKAGTWQGKVTQSHSTVIPFAKKFVERVCALPEVTTIVLGEITSRGRANPSIKITDIGSCIRITVKATDGLQVLRIYTKKGEGNKEKAISALNKISAELI